jgi:hypothetical protein
LEEVAGVRRGLVNGKSPIPATGDAIPIEVSRGPAPFWIMPRGRLVGDREAQIFNRSEAFAGRRSDLAVELRLRHEIELLQ